MARLLLTGLLQPNIVKKNTTMTSNTFNQNSDIAQMAEAIKRYLQQHPQAADTLDGVVNWWLLRQRYETATSIVGKALNQLVEQGELTTITTTGGKTIYRLNSSLKVFDNPATVNLGSETDKDC
jgi:Fe2+ or Zn2+ uptake regulation protein